MIIEFYGYTASIQDLYFLVNSAGAGQMIRDGTGSGAYGIASTSSWTSRSNPPDTGVDWSGQWLTVGIVVANGLATEYLSTGVNPYGSEIGSNPSNSYTISNNGDYLGLVSDIGGGYLYWSGIIIRAYPPNGVMPTITLNWQPLAATNNANTWTAVQTFDATATFNEGIANAAPQNTLTGTTAGSIVYSMPEQGSSYKKFIAYANGYENDTTTAQTITFPTAFTEPPVITTNTTGLTLSASTTTLTINAPDNTTTYTGWIIIEGY